MKVGLVLEGGAMRGLYTAGVIDTFLKEKIEVDKMDALVLQVFSGTGGANCRPCFHTLPEGLFYDEAPYESRRTRH